MKHAIISNESLISADSLLEINIIGGEVEVATYGPRGGIHSFIVLDREEFKNMIEDCIFDLSLYNYEARKELACKLQVGRGK